MDFTINFIEIFTKITYLIFPILFLLLILFIMLGQIVGKIEDWNRFNSAYWSFITAFTVGYGDIRPLKKISKILSILIALIGIMFTGIIVAVTVAAATRAIDQHIESSPSLKIDLNNEKN